MEVVRVVSRFATNQKVGDFIPIYSSLFWSILRAKYWIQSCPEGVWGLDKCLAIEKSAHMNICVIGWMKLVV